VTERELRRLFHGFGEIESVKIQRGEWKNVASQFVSRCFARAEDAQRCLTASPLLQFPDGSQVHLQEYIPVQSREQLKLM
jgi:hypothetical protein